ncbi:putative disease resistance protein RGA3 [Triticum dicoccoides]|uniref:putative disease resistance protein RGA3 n=1 Tax=Triticum dicoccoides TaxID=85692 RepID=UPI001890C0F6|nr:putative disease resistance protein RGA3 [Triticum dicoccoides]XP_037463658.1 putative disease resistance protein RGA3 [Triticum dicoccoides]
MEAAIGAANGLIGSVLSLLSNELVEAFVASSQLGLNYTEMKRDLLFTQGLLQEAQARGKDVSDNFGLRELLKEFSAKADEAEDALDELHYFIIQDQLDGTHYAVPDLGDDLRGHARHGRHALRHTIGNCFACFSCSCMKGLDDGVAAAAITDNPPNAILNPGSDGNDGPVVKLSFNRVAMSKKIKSVIEEIQPLCDRVSTLLKLIPPHSTTTIVTQRHRITGSTIVQDTLYGRRDIFEKTVHDILTIATQHHETLSVLPIVGPGGIGMTTFTQHLYNDKRIEEHFVVRVWVCVSTDCDELRLSQQVLSSIEGSNSPNQTTSLDQLQISIAERLKSKRFLIVFDDIWECNGEGWKKLLAPFKKGEAKGNMVLVTTRFPTISEMVKTTNTIALQGLEFDDFFTFFKSLIFEGIKLEYYQEDFDDIARDIANKLKGSPLAAKTVGRLLRKEFSREHWMGVLDNNEWQKQKNSDDIMPSLRISYDHLPFHLKKCFSYFALFPEDYWFRSLDITCFWIALGVIEKYENYIEEFVENGFLVKEVDHKKEPYYVIHDLLHELSRSVSSPECLNIRSSGFRVGDIPQTVRHLSITTEDRFEENFRVEMIKLRSKIDIGNLRALMIFGGYEDTIDGMLKDICKEVEGLRVLHIGVRFKESLPLNFSKLIHLRYLKIWHPNLGCRLISSTLSRFYHLKYLDLFDFCVNLPKDINRLINLRHFGVISLLHAQVPGVGKMKCLQELKQFSIKKESVGFELRELGELTELGGELTIYGLEKVATMEEAKEAKLVCKRDLKKLTLVWGTDHQNSDVLDALQPHPNLQALGIRNHGGTSGPSWLCGDISIKMLGSLHLEGVSWGTLPPFGQLLHLTSLTLISISVLRDIRPGFGGVTDKSFVNLKNIVLDRLPEFVEWVGGANAQSFSRLECIRCKDCPKLCVVPFLECTVSYATLSNFVVDDCPKLSLPPMPHTPTLTSYLVRLGSTKLSYDDEGLVIDGYSGELAWDNLHEVEGIRIENVSHISLTELSKLKSLKGLCFSKCNITWHEPQDFTWLQGLAVENCGNFFRWPIEAAHTKPFPASLRCLEIFGESSMQSMALLSDLTCLESLALLDCENLTVDGFNPLITVNLNSLWVYNKGNCLSRSISADLLSELVVARTNLSLSAGSFQLEYLTVDCTSVVFVAPICSLLAATLQGLRFRCDQRAESFTGEEDGALQLLTSLRYITFEDCPNLPCLPQVAHGLPSLCDLEVKGCPQIRSLPKGGFPTSLSVSVTGCNRELNEQLQKLKETNPDVRVYIH